MALSTSCRGPFVSDQLLLGDEILRDHVRTPPAPTNSAVITATLDSAREFEIRDAHVNLGRDRATGPWRSVPEALRRFKDDVDSVGFLEAHASSGCVDPPIIG